MLRAAWNRIHAWMDPKRFQYLCVGTLVFVVGVILWGALVRATGSGAGCGQHWPLCNGEMLPSLSRYQTIIEFTHRLTSGLSLLLVFALGHFAFRLYPRGHVIRRLAGWSMVAIVVEALIGAGLVLLRLVEHDRSVDRAVSIVLHLGNTCILVGVLALTSWAAARARSTDRARVLPVASAAHRQGAWVLVGFVILAGTGALTALGDTLFEVSSFRQGWIRDWAKDAHFLERLRVFHPLLALFWMGLAISWLQSQRSAWSRRALVFLLTNMVIGAANVLLAAPLVLQLLHLLVANLLWISLVLSYIECTSAESAVFAEPAVR
jgi:cytochrome c oxidase assembly protein subunit 15